MTEWGWFQWASDVNRLEPGKKYAWVLVPLSFLILVGGVGAVVAISLVLTGWLLWAVGVGVALVALALEWFLVTRLLPDRIRRPR